MMDEAQLRESTILRSLQQAAEARGLTFYIKPPRDVVPAFLGDFQPDAIAVGPNGGIIVEVELRSSSPEHQLAAIAKRVCDQQGWEFRAIYLDPAKSGIAPIARPTAKQVHSQLGEIRDLRNGGHLAAAFITAWAVLESLARLAIDESRARPSEGLSPLQAVQILAEEGYLENDVADQLRAMVKLRNAVVHGDFSVDIPTEQVDRLFKQLEVLGSDIMSTTPEGAC